MLPSAYIKPSEMCGMDTQHIDMYARAEMVHVRRASAVRIMAAGGNAAEGSGRRPQSIVIVRNRTSLDSPSTPRSHRQHQSIDLEARGSPKDDGMRHSFEDLLEEARPQSSTSISEASQDSRTSQKHRLGPRTSRESAGEADRQQCRPQKLFKIKRISQRMSPELVTIVDTSMQDGQMRKSDEDVVTPRSPSSPRRRFRDRPILQAVGDGPHEAKVTVGTLSSRPLSLAAQKSPTSRWTPSTSSSEAGSKPHSSHKRSATTTYLDMSTLRYDASELDDSSSVEIDLLNEVKHSPAAAYMAAQNYMDAKEQPASTTTNDQGNRATWLMDTDSDDHPPTTTMRPQSSLIYWDPTKEANMSASERSAGQSENEDWPLPIVHSKLYVPYVTPTTEQPLPPQDVPRTASHSSTLSRDTTSSSSTVLSPTFTSDVPKSAESTPFASPEIGQQRANTLDVEIPSDAVSIAPSDVSGQWKQSPKERLGLGGIVRKSQGSPWDTEKPPGRLHKAEKPSKPTKAEKQTPKRTQSNRLSSLMKWRRAALDDLHQQERHLMYLERHGVQRA